jgi:hypothetical protein
MGQTETLPFGGALDREMGGCEHQFFWGSRKTIMIVVKLILELCRGVAAMVCCGCLFFAAGILLQGVAQLAGEGLAKQPETSEEVYSGLRIVFGLLSAGFCGSVVFQTASVFLGRWQDARPLPVRKAVFEGLVFWGGACLFLCLLILTGSVQARWEVAGAYYWLAGGAGITTLFLLGAAHFFAAIKPHKADTQNATADRRRFWRQH